MKLLLKSANKGDIQEQFASHRIIPRQIKSDCPEILLHEKNKWQSERHVKMGIRQVQVDENWTIFTF